MLLKQVFSPECIKINLESQSKDELFEELVDGFVTAKSCYADRASILKAIKEREALMSTGIKKGIAIPHGKTSAVSGVKGFLGISRDGIDYESLDNEPVYLVFLLLSSPSDAEQHLRALKGLACLLENPAFQASLMEATSAQNAYDIIQKYENTMNAGE
jgi:PTS system fructose-specific IIC component/PTS system nitrogen regulatory IIA component